MSLYFVVIFIVSLKKIRDTLQQTKYAKNFVNEREMKAQLVAFVAFITVYVINHSLQETNVYMALQVHKSGYDR